MNMRLNMPVRELELAHGYFSEQYMRRRLEGQPIRSAPVAVPRADDRPRVDWRTGLRVDEAQMAEQFNSDIAAGES